MSKPDMLPDVCLPLYPDDTTILDRVISPSQVVADLAKKGVIISERVLRQRARQLGAFRQIGRAMFFTADDLERIMAPDRKPEPLPTMPDCKKRMERRNPKEAVVERRPASPPLPYRRGDRDQT